MRATRVQRWTNLFNVLKWPLMFAAILVYLPLTAFRSVPGNSLLGGLFVELGLWQVFWVTIGFCAASWSLMFATGLLVEGARTRLDPSAAAGGGDDGAASVVPGWAARLFRLPVSRPLFAAATALVAYGAALLAGHGLAPWWASLLAALAGGLVAYGLLAALTVPVRLAYRDQGYDPLPRSRIGRLLFRLFDRRPLARAAAAVRDVASRLAAALGFRHLLEPGVRPPRLQPDHFFAFTNVVGLLVLVGLAGWFFFPPRQPPVTAPAAAYAYVLLVLLIWTLLGIDFHLSRLRISPAFVLVAIMIVVFTLDDADHYYFVRREPPPEQRLTPTATVAAGRRPENLVVVASAGGGILASGWTNLALQNLLADRPALADEIRLLSTVSGGSVGAAFYVDALRDGPDLAGATPDEVYAFLGCVYDQSTASSLSSAAYGFAFLDFWRLFVGGWPPLLQHWDRGILLERAWAENAAPTCPGADAAGTGRRAFGPTLGDLRPAIREGRLPAVILNATVMETGRRLMQTPLDFPPPPPGVALDDERAQTLSEFLFDPAAATADPVLWTAARMSATFPYISPAARAEVRTDWRREGERPGGTAALHLIDGGYYDNFGVASTLDWLQPVLAARLAGEPAGAPLAFRKVLVVQLNPFAATDPAAARPVAGSVAALLGPVVGLTAIQNGVAVTRNKIDLTRELASWNARFRDAGLDVCLRTVEFRPPAGTDEPLSWHLTRAQIASQRAAWPRRRADAPPNLRASWDAMTEFLEGPCPPGAATTPAAADLTAPAPAAP